MAFDWIIDFKRKITALCFREKNRIKLIFSPILLSERNMGVDNFDNTLDYENPL